MLKVNHTLMTNDDDIKFVRITLIVEYLAEVSPCLWSLFHKSYDDSWRYQFDVSLPYNPHNPKSHSLFPYACIELFVMNQIFNMFYEKYAEKYEEYDSVGLNLNAGFNIDYALYKDSKSDVIRPNEWNKLRFSEGNPSDRMWDMKFNIVGRGTLL